VLFPIPTLISLVVFLAGILYIAFSLFIVSPEDVQEYRKLMANTNSVENPVHHAYVAKQFREDVQKQIFYQKGNDRLEMRINSTSAKLVFDHQDDQTSIAEIMQNVRCYIQEAFYLSPNNQPMQRLLYLEAATARYDYKIEQIVAEHVKLLRYEMNGYAFDQLLDDSMPVMQGEANSAKFDLTTGQMHFTDFRLTTTLLDGDKSYE